MVGVGTVMENGVAVEGLPPVLTAVTLALPGAAIRLAGTIAVNWVALTNVVVRAAPFHCTVAPERKPVAFTVSVNADPPAGVEAGFRLVITGVGALIRKVVAADTLPPVFIAVTLALLAVAIRLAGSRRRHLRRSNESSSDGGAVPLHRRSGEETRAIHRQGE